MSASNPGSPLPATAPDARKPAPPRRSLAWKLIRSTNSLMAHFSGTRFIPLWAILEHEGRTSGRSYETPVAARRISNGFFIPMPFGAGTDWTRNVITAGGCAIRWKGRRYELTNPEVVDTEAARSAFNRVQRVMLRPIGIDQFLRLRDAR
jgi:deazaflavin-dependent oxidoreductase (nitroreductase family)